MQYYNIAWDISAIILQSFCAVWVRLQTYSTHCSSFLHRSILLAFTESEERASGWRKTLWCLFPISYHWVAIDYSWRSAKNTYVWWLSTVIDNRTDEVKKSEPKTESNRTGKHFWSSYHFGPLACTIFRFGYRFRSDKNSDYGPVIDFGFGPIRVPELIKEFVNVWKLHYSSIYFFSFGVVKAFHLTFKQ